MNLFTHHKVLINEKILETLVLYINPLILGRSLNLQPVEGEKSTYNTVPFIFLAKREIELAAKHG